MTDKKTGSKVTQTAAKTLPAAKAPAAHKKTAGSALAQSGTAKKTSPPAAKEAAKQLGSSATPKKQKAVAASVLSQKEKPARAKK